jgi:A/G-specific adenine glycosylase
MALTDESVETLQNHLLTWFAQNRRDLPWRLTRDPYQILVSEVMLQQTQVDRVIPYFERWLARFPDLTALAEAPTRDVIEIWAGLGYNRRAVNLQRTAQAVRDEHGGTFPSDAAALQALPGIGPYTAGAIAAFAFEQDAVFLDTNMRRVVHRLVFGSDIPALTVTELKLLDAAESLLPEGYGWLWNQALIEFGALQCTRRRPACVICPMQNDCAAFPAIQSDIAGMPVGVRLKNEGTFEGSNRQYRGRIVDTLRTTSSIPMSALGPTIKVDYSETDEPWLFALVEGLRRDGLVVLREAEPQWPDSASSPTVIIALP